MRTISKNQMIEFMQEYNFLDASEEAIMKIIEGSVDAEGNIEYDTCIRAIVQD